MQDIIKELVEKAGISAEQASKSIMVMKEFIQGKLPPGFSAMVDNFFASQQQNDTIDPLDSNAGAGLGAAVGNMGAKPESLTEKAKDAAEKAGDKIEDLAEDATEKVKEFAKNANEKMNEWMKEAEEKGEDLMGKLKDIFGGKKEEDKS